MINETSRDMPIWEPFMSIACAPGEEVSEARGSIAVVDASLRLAATARSLAISPVVDGVK
jgi:hypothetical protein